MRITFATNLNILAINLQYRIDLFKRVGEYILAGENEWKKVKEKAGIENPWFIPEFVDSAAANITDQFLQKKILEDWVNKYALPDVNKNPKAVGIVMAGNIPLVGFHDLLSVFISGHRAIIKPSSKDNVLIRHIVEKLNEWEPATKELLRFEEMLKGCNAYIATGSNNSSRYFSYYFGKYPNIIRRNKTSVAIIDGTEPKEDLEKLADDVFLYFGLGCRNVTKLYVPEKYDFVPLLDAFNKYKQLADHNKYKNNYDYNLALHVLNKKFYMTNGAVIVSENESVFSPISQLNYEFYTEKENSIKKIETKHDIQCIVGKGNITFGQSQTPKIDDYADATDTMEFLINL